jgi:anaerobic magnesium-protoporphyrin IX monomethyl ester cyclase
MKVAFCSAEDINLGTGYVISYLKSQGHEVRMFFDPKQFDRAYLRNSFLRRLFSIEDYNIKEIKKFNPDICCFSCITATYQWALGMAKKVKEYVGCKIIFGGIHPTLVPEEVRRHSFIDVVVERDGIEYFGGKFDPDLIFPDREIFLAELPAEHRKVQLFMSSIGCPFNCSFCGNEQLRKLGAYKFIKRSVDGCMRELHQIKESGAKLILIADDILTINKTWLKEFFERYSKEIDLPFTCFIHPKYIDEETIKLLKDNNCQSCWIGIQQGDENLRKQIMHRPETNDEIKATAKLVKDAGIVLIIDHIFGVPYESELSQDLSVNLYREIKPDIVNCYQLLYFPKAGIIEYALKCGYLKKPDIDIINQGKGIVYTTNNKGEKFYDTYIKSFITIPLNNVLWELMPVFLIKIIVLLKAKRAFTLIAILQNEVFFMWRTILKKTGLYGMGKNNI